MAKRDFYETLGVAKTATDAELKSAFRKAAMQCHPDRHPGDKQAEARFKELNEAYQHLSDAQKRAAYDRYGHAAFDQSGMSDGFASSMSDIFDDLFGDMMGGGRRGRQALQAGSAALTCAIISRSRSKRRFTARPRRSHADFGRLRSLLRLRRARRLAARDLQDLRRTRARARATGLLRHRAHLPDVVTAAGRRSRTLATNAPGPAA